MLVCFAGKVVVSKSESVPVYCPIAVAQGLVYEVGTVNYFFLGRAGAFQPTHMRGVVGYSRES